ncbi:DUF3887 domain-containing protein [Streptomyces sp. NPDC023588]|uniref:DUF3887 domain-containing protein n=1 Tax=Streptomyces sp. NPDC023588 TaxID=3154907 RepID=UPI0033DAD90B
MPGRPATLEKVVVLMPDQAHPLGSKRHLAQAATAAALAAGAVLPLTGFAPAAAPAQAQTQTVAAPAAPLAPAQSRYDRITLQALDAIVNGTYTAATAHFDPRLAKLLPPDALAEAWETYQDEFGRYGSHGDPQDVAFGEFTVVNVPLRMERGPGEFRVTFHPDGSIAGLLFLKPGVPIS